MTDAEFFDKIKAKCVGYKIEDVVATEIVERINHTTRLELEVRKLWTAIIIIFILLGVTAIAGCASREVNKCTYICPKGNPPQDCYCIEDEIEREVSNFHQ